MSHQVRISREAEELVIFGFLLGVFSSCAFVCSRFLFGLRLPIVGLLVCWWLDSAVSVIVLCGSALVEVLMGRLLKWPRVKQLAVLQDCNLIFDPYHFSDLLLYAVHPCRSYRTLYQPNSIILNWDYWDHLRLNLKLLAMIFPWKIVLFVIQSYWGQLATSSFHVVIRHPPRNAVEATQYHGP